MIKRQPTFSAKHFVNLFFVVSILGCIFHFASAKVSDDGCGSVDFLDPRISGGSVTHRGEWPFLAALYYVEQLKFFCGGTLITKQHVLTGTWSMIMNV